MAVRKIEFYGTKELLNRLERAGANVIDECVKACKAGNEEPKKRMLSHIHDHYRTGETEKSFMEEIKVKGDKITNRLGFDINNGGLPAVFLEYGTPHTEIEGFITYSVNRYELEEAQTKALANAFKELL